MFLPHFLTYCCTIFDFCTSREEDTGTGTGTLNSAPSIKKNRLQFFYLKKNTNSGGRICKIYFALENGRCGVNVLAVKGALQQRNVPAAP